MTAILPSAAHKIDDQVVKRNGAGGRWTKIDIAQLEEASNSN
jgi:hypothetical protein